MIHNAQWVVQTAWHASVLAGVGVTTSSVYQRPSVRPPPHDSIDHQTQTAKLMDDPKTTTPDVLLAS